jgi:hypothetical protein
VLNSSQRRISLPHESLCNVCGDCNLIGLRPEEVPRVYLLGRKNHLGMQFMVKRLIAYNSPRLTWLTTAVVSPLFRVMQRPGGDLFRTSGA